MTPPVIDKGEAATTALPRRATLLCKVVGRHASSLRGAPRARSDPAPEAAATARTQLLKIHSKPVARGAASGAAFPPRGTDWAAPRAQGSCCGANITKKTVYTPFCRKWPLWRTPLRPTRNGGSAGRTGQNLARRGDSGRRTLRSNLNLHPSFHS